MSPKLLNVRVGYLMQLAVKLEQRNVQARVITLAQLVLPSTIPLYALGELWKIQRKTIQSVKDMMDKTHPEAFILSFV